MYKYNSSWKPTIVCGLQLVRGGTRFLHVCVQIFGGGGSTVCIQKYNINAVVSHKQTRLMCC